MVRIPKKSSLSVLIPSFGTALLIAAGLGTTPPAWADDEEKVRAALGGVSAPAESAPKVGMYMRVMKAPQVGIYEEMVRALPRKETKRGFSKIFKDALNLSDPELEAIRKGNRDSLEYNTARRKVDAALALPPAGESVRPLNLVGMPGRDGAEGSAPVQSTGRGDANRFRNVTDAQLARAGLNGEEIDGIRQGKGSGYESGAKRYEAFREKVEALGSLADAFRKASAGDRANFFETRLADQIVESIEKGVKPPKDPYSDGVLASNTRGANPLHNVTDEELGKAGLTDREIKAIRQGKRSKTAQEGVKKFHTYLENDPNKGRIKGELKVLEAMLADWKKNPASPPGLYMHEMKQPFDRNGESMRRLAPELGFKWRCDAVKNHRTVRSEVCAHEVMKDSEILSCVPVAKRQVEDCQSVEGGKQWECKAASECVWSADECVPSMEEVKSPFVKRFASSIGDEDTRLCRLKPGVEDTFRRQPAAGASSAGSAH